MEHSLTEFPELFFAWWNTIINRDEQTSSSEFARFFADDAQIITNDKLVCEGLAAITEHFMAVKRKTRSCEVRLPMEKTFSAGDDVFVHYTIVGEIEEKRQVISVMGYMRFEAGKIKLSRQLQHIADPVCV